MPPFSILLCPCAPHLLHAIEEFVLACTVQFLVSVFTTLIASKYRCLSQHPSERRLKGSFQQIPLCVVPSTPFQRAGSHRATSPFPPALAHAGMSELPSEIEKVTRPPAPLPEVAHPQSCCTPASHSPSPSDAARTVPWFRNPIQEFHSVTPDSLISFSADTIHAVVSTLPGHCDRALLEQLPMLVPHTDE